MPDFISCPIPTEIGDRWRDTGVDDGNNSLRRMNADASPCRHCLRDASASDEMILGSYRLPRPQGIYWTPSPIFVHAQPCARFAEIDVIAPIVRNRLVSMRAYDHHDQCIYDLGHVSDGNAIDNPLMRALDD